MDAVLIRYNTPYNFFSDPIFDTYDREVFSVLPIYSKLAKAGLRIWVYR